MVLDTAFAMVCWWSWVLPDTVNEDGCDALDE